MTSRNREQGFSAVELLIALAVIGSLTAIGIPISGGMVDDIRLRGDAQGLAGAMALTKMTAAARFTRARLHVNVAANTYRLEVWQANGWTIDETDRALASGDRFGPGTVATPPPDSQATVSQPGLCRDNDNQTIAGTACVIFNSRGLPVNDAGAPMTTQVMYLRGTAGVFAVVIGGNGQQQLWRTTLNSSGTWRQQ